MKGKKLIVIMAIVILMFTIQASFALDDSNDFNLTQTTDVDTVDEVIKVDTQIDDANQDVIVNESIESNSNVSDVVDVAPQNNLLGVSNNDPVLGERYHVPSNSLLELMQVLRNAKQNDVVFLDGRTFTGDCDIVGIIKRNVQIYGGSSETDTRTATLDLSKFTKNEVIRFDSGSSGAKITGVNFINYNMTSSSYMITTGMNTGNAVRNIRLRNCEFINNTIAGHGYIIRFYVADNNAELSNCKFIDNTASVLVYFQINPNAAGPLRVKAFNNQFINNTGTQRNTSGTNSLGLCFKISKGIVDTVFENNTFINNTNALHGTAYCILGKNITILNNYLEGNQAVYGSGIEAHENTTVSVINSTFINNVAKGYNPLKDPLRNASGATIAFLGSNSLVDNCKFINNTAYNYAGAIDIVGSNTTILNSVFTNNVAKNYGGAVNIIGPDTYIGNCTFEDNRAAIGGAMNLKGLDVAVVDSNFTNNSAIQGAACYIEGFNSTIQSSMFTNNNATHDLGNIVEDDPSMVTAGGAIFILGDNANIIDDTFEINDAQGSYANKDGLGGALYIKGANINFHDDVFTDNTAISGGAVYIRGDNLDAKNINLTNNQAVQGGAIYVEGGDVEIISSNFEDNRAIQSGAVFVQGNDVKIMDSNFDGNNATRDVSVNTTGTDSLIVRGGAVGVGGNNVELYDNNFTSNVAQGTTVNGGHGGAIYVKGDNTTIYDNIVTQNEAVEGGAIYILGNNATIKNMDFISNNAVRGGAITVNGTGNVITGNTFYDNNATHNLRFNTTAEVGNHTTIGGAISANGNYTVITNNTFTYNAAISFNPNGGYGGAIGVKGYSINITDNIFKENEAILGGAVYVVGTDTLIGDSNFTYNNAIRGGAVYVDGLNASIINSSFMQNNATHNLTYNTKMDYDSMQTWGGAVTINGNGTLIKDSLFDTNTAIGINPDGGLGGAVFVKGYNTTLDAIEFVNNQAIIGGALYINGTLNTLNATNFTRNSAIRGGAVYNRASNTTIIDSLFDNNTATHDLRYKVNDKLYNLTTIGGAVNINGASVNVTNCEFTNNTAVTIFKEGGHGGAIAVNGSDNVIFNSTFKDNEAIKGGAFYLEGDKTAIIDSYFNDNNALKGGAGYIDGKDSTIENSTFDDNDGTHNLRFNLPDVLKNETTAGGAVYITGDDINVTSSNFTNNDAKAFNENVTLGGGAFYIEGNNANISSSYFENNTALKGGAVFITGNSTNIYDSNFTRNSVTNFTVNEGFGGAVYLENSHDSDFTRCNFESNTASINGGAIDWHEGATDGQIVDCTFTNNTAGANAGAVFWFGTGGIIKGSNFTDNAANGTVKSLMGNAGEGGAIMWTGSNGVVDDCNFVNNTAANNGGAVYLRGVPGRAECNNNSFVNSHFENNTAGVNGGAIDWHEGATNGNIENTTFVNNSARANGGAVYWVGNNGTIVGSNFTDNRALGEVNGTYGDYGCGGAIIWAGSNGLVDDCIFINNNATRLGGAVYLHNITANGCDNTTFANSHFENNTAGINGGAINWHEGATNGRIEDSTFVNNTARANGGAVFWFGDNGTISGSNFTDNRALGEVPGTHVETGCGGAVIWTGSNGLVDNSNFVDNYAAKNGGAVYLRNLTANGCDNTTFANSHFENNTAEINGGAIDWHEGATNGRIESSTFVNNSAKANGGAVFWYGTNGTIVDSNFTENKALGINNSTYGNSGCGGAVIWTGSNGLVDNSNFVDNYAAKNGGAVYLRNLTAGDCDNTTFANSHFENNTAEINGGAIDWHEGAINGRIESSTFVNNSANANGGAVFWYGTNGTIVDSNFTENKALGINNGTYGNSGCGGAVIWTGSNGLVDNSNFVDNYAAQNGGAVYLRNLTAGDCDNTTFANSHFENNTAGINGGAINWHDGATNGRIENSTFVNNSAKANGGAVYWFGTNGTIAGSNFTNNRALNESQGIYGYSGEGGAVIWTGSNGLVDDCIFENNSAKNNGGAVYLRGIGQYNCNNTVFTNSKFINNSASKEGGAIDWNEGATYGKVENSTFDSNTAQDGGAISWTGHNGEILNSNFTNNVASRNGGAVRWSGIDGEIENCNFMNNTAANGGAIYLQNCAHSDKTNVTIKDSTFGNNTATQDGGAINWFKGAEATIDNSEFVDNVAKRGGAVFVNGTDGIIKNSNFTSNEAIVGGATYLNSQGVKVTDSQFDENLAVQGGAAFIEGKNNHIENSTFMNNNATYALNNVNTTGNTRKTKGGAVYINGENANVIDSKFYNNTAVTNRAYNNQSNDPTASDDGFGGAIFVGANNALIDSSEFNDNRACNGSAVYNDAQNTYLKQDTFIKNQAWSYKLDANATQFINYYGRDVTIEIANYTGGDNIINGIYNAKSVNDIIFDSVKYLINSSESNIGITSQPNPVSGAANSDNGKYLYQDSLERYQKIIVEFINNETGNVVATQVVRTDIYGNNTFNISGLAPGNYTVRAYHPEDRNYKGIYTLSSFRVLPSVDLTITRTVNNYYIVNGDNVTFTITVSNAANASNATNVKLKELIPVNARLQLLQANVTKGTFNSNNFTWDISSLNNGENVTLTLTFKTTTLGVFNNTANVTCSEHEWNYTNNNATALFEVIDVNLTIDKTANVNGNISVGDDVTFTINVTNNAKINVTNVVVTDIVPAGFKYVDSNATYDNKTGKLIINVLESKKSFIFTITLTAITNGTLTNYVNVTCNENSTVKKANASVNVTPVVKLNITKVTEFDGYINGDVVNFTITVTNLGPSDATHVVVKDYIPNGLDPISTQGRMVIEYLGFIPSGGSKKITIQAKINLPTPLSGPTNITNTANVTCNENQTVISANATVCVYNVDLRVSKTADVSSVPVHGLVNFTITVKNRSPDIATNVNITDTLDSVFIILNANGTYSQNGNKLTWNVARLAPDEVYSVWVLVNTTTNGTFENTAYANCTEEGHLQHHTATVEVTPVVKLKVNKTSNIPAGTNVTISKNVVFTINVTNEGVSNATGVKITDLVPQGFEFIGTNATGYNNKTGLLAIDLIKPGESKVFTITLKAISVGNLTNVVNVTCKENNGLVSANASVNVVPVILTVNKTVDINLVANNTLVNFTITVKNIGISDASDINVTDELPVGFAFVNVTKGNTTVGNNVSWNIAKLDAGGEQKFWILARSVAVGNWTNVVNVSCSENRTELCSNASVEVAPVELTVDKVASLPVVGNNTLVNFTITVNNIGKVNATYVLVEDMLPNGFTFVNASKGYANKAQGVNWTIDKFNVSDVAEFWVVARSNAVGNWTNAVNVSCYENDTVVDASALVEVVPVKLTVDKIASLPVVANNTLVNFTITVSNAGDIAATNVLVKDLLPVGFTFINASKGYDNNGQAVNWTIANLNVGDVAEFWVVARSNAVGNWTNEVNVSCYENDTIVDASALVKVLEVNATLVKQADLDVVGNNTVVKFTITVNNTALVNATNVLVTDVLPNGFMFVDASAGYSRNGQTVTWNLGTLTSGQSSVLWITARSNETGTWKNVVNASSSENDTLAEDNATVKVAEVNATLDKVANVTEIGSNSLVNYTITVNYTSIVNATNVVITDSLPAGLIFVNATEGYSQNGQIITWNVGNLTPGQTLNYWIVVRTTDIGDFTNNVKVNCSENTTILDKNATISVLPMNATLNKTANITDVGNNTLVTFTIVVNNTAKVNATNVVYTDILPAGLAYVSSDSDIADKGTYTKLQNGSEIVTWKMDTLTPGQIVTLYVVAKSVAVGNWTNVVNATCNENTTILSTDETVNVLPVNLTVIKTSDRPSYELYDLVSYTIEVTNNAKINATNVVITDVIDLTKFEVQSSNVTYRLDGNTFIWNVSSLKPGETFSIQIVVKALDSGNFTNEVNVTSAENSTISTNGTSIEVTPIVNLIINKTVDVERIGLYDDAVFTISVTNKGPSVATNVVITDVVPKGLEVIAVSHPDFDYNTNQLVIERLFVNQTVEFTILVDGIKTGKYVNVVNVTCKENSTCISDNASLEVIVVNLTVDKKADAKAVGNNSLVNFTIIITNHDDIDATGLEIIDELPDGFTFVSAAGNYHIDNNVVTWFVNKVTKNNPVELWVVARSNELGNKTNNVRVRYVENDDNISADATVSVVPVNLSIIKTAEHRIVHPYEDVTFTITVTNGAEADATNVTVTDVVPAGFEFVKSSAQGYDNATGVLNIPIIKAGESYAFTITLKTLVIGGSLTNVVSVNSNENKTVVKSNVTVGVYDSSIKVENTANDNFVYSGNQTSFTVKITNDGHVVLTDIVVYEDIPKELIYDHFIGTNWTYDGEKFTYTGSLAVGDSIELTIVLNSTVSGTFYNIATVGTTQTEEVFAEDSVIVYTPELTVREISNNPRAIVGQIVSFTVVVTNVGDCDLSGVYVLNNYPDELIYKNFTGSGWSGLSAALSSEGYDLLGAVYTGTWTMDGNKLSYSGILKPQESANYTLYFQTTRTGTFVAEAIANSDLTNNAYSNNTTVVVEPKLVVEKVADKNSVNVSDYVTFTITVKNVGDCDLSGIFVQEITPKELKYVKFIGKGWTKVGDKFVYSGVLAPGEQAILKIIFQAISAGNVTNIVIAGSNMTSTVQANSTVKIVNETDEPPVDPNDTETHEHVESTKPVEMPATGNPIMMLLLVIVAIIPLRRRKH